MDINYSPQLPSTWLKTGRSGNGQGRMGGSDCDIKIFLKNIKSERKVMKVKLISNLLFVTLYIALSYFLCTAAENKQLDQQAIARLQAGFQLDNTNKALMNAITNNDIDNLVLNRELINKHNNVFNLNIAVEGITDQQSTGRCWMFAALNLMRPIVKERYSLKSFEFSEVYLFFWDKLDKANYFLETIIETRDRDIDDRELQAFFADPIPDGGWWNYVVNLIEKYGVIPKELMPETVNSNKSYLMNKTLLNLARQDAAELREMSALGKSENSLRERKMEMLPDFYRLLVLYFGLPPQNFTWRVENKDNKLIEKKYTPLEFYKDAVKLDLNQYVILCEYPSFPRNDFYQVNFCTNMTEKPDMSFINVDNEKLKKYALSCLTDSTPVWFAADVGWQMERDLGIMAADIYDYQLLFNIKDTMTKADRIRYRASNANHAMLFVGADTSNGKVLKWRVENSWGSDRGNKGYWTLYDNWFDKYVFTVIINRKYLKSEELKLLDRKPKKIPAWDPLRSSFLVN
jgi:bleomycin hydrolase